MRPPKNRNNWRLRVWRLGLVVAARLALFLGPAAVFWPAAQSHGQTAWPAGRHWAARRVVTLKTAPANDNQVYVVEFLAHGELTDERQGLEVLTQQQRPIPFKLLSRGPGDLVRIAFQGARDSSHYEIYYGGEPLANTANWTADVGLVLDARQFVECDLEDPKSVLAAWSRASPLGCDYVPNVFQGFLQFADEGTPVLCRFTGQLRIQKPGLYRFYTSSCDASWLQVDGEIVASWAGRHPNDREGKHFGDRQLTAGVHAFDFVYASTGADFIAVAAWKPPGDERIVAIPWDAFGRIHRATASPPQLRTGESLPDFKFENAAEMPLGEGLPPLVRTRFTTPTPELSHEWDFGDGQTMTSKEPHHIYLLPGEYVVRCKLSNGPTVESRIQIHAPRPPVVEKIGELGEYDVKRLEAPALLQLFSVYAKLEDFERAASIGLEGLRQRARGAVPLEPQTSALLCHELARLLDRPLNRQNEALAVCRDVLGLQPTGKPRLQLLLDAIDLALKLDRCDDADHDLETAKSQLVETTPTLLRTRLFQLQGDLFRRKRDRDRAVKSYTAAAEHAVSSGWDARQRIILPGAYSRSIEEYLRTNDRAAAAETLERWSDELPTSHLDGYYTLLKANCYMAYDQPRLAVLEASDLLGLDQDDPYADRLLLLMAEAQFRMDEIPAAQSTLERLLRDYPGSPHTSTARSWLKDGPDKSGKRPRTKSSTPSKKQAKER